MEQMESIYENLNKFRKQQEQQHKALEATETVYEEPVYDSLEKVCIGSDRGICVCACVRVCACACVYVYVCVYC